MTGATLAAARSGSHSATASAAAAQRCERMHGKAAPAQRSGRCWWDLSACLWQVSNLAITTIFVLEAVLRVVQKGFVLGKHTYL
jgi:hypothetical protein